MNPERFVHVVDLGKTEYGDCWAIQKKLFDLRKENLIPDTLLLTEHPHTYTIGTSGDESHLLASEEEMVNRGVKLFHNDRGGDITYHGPGQIVGYPILDLNNFYLDLHRYLRDLEEVIIRTLSSFGLVGTRICDYTGVWVGNEKICAIGVKTSKWVTMHGFAFNVLTDLSYFERIIPCGIFEKGITSLHQLLETPPDVKAVKSTLAWMFGEVFDVGVLHEKLVSLLPEYGPVVS